METNFQNTTGAPLELPQWNGEIFKFEDVNQILKTINDFAEKSNSAFAHWTVDGGKFEDDPAAVARHNAQPASHPNMLAYGGSLEEHLADPDAHPDIVLDGNLI